MRVDDRTIQFLIAFAYLSALMSLAYSGISGQRWAFLFGCVLAAGGGIFHVAEALFTRE